VHFISEENRTCPNSCSLYQKLHIKPYHELCKPQDSFQILSWPNITLPLLVRCPPRRKSGVGRLEAKVEPPST